MDEYRFGLQSMRSWCDQTFESEEVKCLFGAFALFMAHAPDDAGGAELAWLFGTVLQDVGNNLVKGGMHHVSLALADHLRSLGGEIRTNAGVEKILVSSGRATGVRLEGGEEIPVGRLVASGVDPRQLALKFLGEEIIGPELAGKMERYEWGDPAFVIYAALDGPVEYKAGPEAGAACHVHLTPPSLDPVARASAECRGGELPATPLVVSWNDSVIDPSRAPEGKHLKKFVVLGVPYEIKGDATGQIEERDWDEAKDKYADYLIDRITADYIPDLREKLLKREAHSPLDLERKLTSAVHGTICHGAMLPYQTGSMRPIPEMGDYRSPVQNVYLCGSGSHPGPGVSMAPGRNAAEAICRISASTSPRRSPPGLPGRSICPYEAAETFRDARCALGRAQGRRKAGRGRDLLPDLDPDLRLDHLLPPDHRDDRPRAGRGGAGLQLRPLRQPYGSRFRGGPHIAGGS
jgi:beta-carotene ketolase (CrtO type)